MTYAHHVVAQIAPHVPYVDGSPNKGVTQDDDKGYVKRWGNNNAVGTGDVHYYPVRKTSSESADAVTTHVQLCFKRFAEHGSMQCLVTAVFDVTGGCKVRCSSVGTDMLGMATVALPTRSDCVCALLCCAVCSTGAIATTARTQTSTPKHDLCLSLASSLTQLGIRSRKFWELGTCMLTAVRCTGGNGSSPMRLPVFSTSPRYILGFLRTVSVLIWDSGDGGFALTELDICRYTIDRLRTLQVSVCRPTIESLQKSTKRTFCCSACTDTICV